MNDKPALKVLLLLTCGMVLGYCFDVSVLPAFLLCTGLTAGFFILRRFNSGSEKWPLVLLGASLIAIGYLRFEFTTSYFPSNHISNFTFSAEPCAVTGVVVRYPEKRQRTTHLVVDVREIQMAGGPSLEVNGRLIARVRKGAGQTSYGDEIVLRSRLRQPERARNPGEFDYRKYLQAQDIFAVMDIRHGDELQVLRRNQGNFLFREIVVPAKTYIDNYVSAVLPEEEAALLQGLLIGERGEIDYATREAFAKLGVIHILAVSGMHVGFVMIVLIGLASLMRLPYKAQVILTILGLIFYCFLTNLKPPVVRASIMGGLIILGAILERRTNVYNSLAVAALIILLLNPLELFQPGFQLSFSAVLAIVYFYPKLEALLPGKLRSLPNPALKWVPGLLLVSGAAFIGTLPFTVLYFNRIPNLSLLANIVVIPLVFISVASAISAALLNLWLPAVAGLFMETTWLCLHGTLSFVGWGSTIPFASMEAFGFSAWHGVAFIAGVILLINLQLKPCRRWLVILLLLVTNGLVWTSVFDERGSSLEIVFIDVGQGDAVLINFPEDKHILIDGGPRSLYFDAGERIVAPYLKRRGIRHLDAVILSHGDSDHLGGVPFILRNFDVRQVWDNGLTKDTQLFQEYTHLVDSLQIEQVVLRSGDLDTSFAPAGIFVVHPSEQFTQANHSANDASLSLKLSYGEMDFLFLGDIESSGEKDVSKYGNFLTSEVLKVSHHGSKTSSSAIFLQHAHPELAVISVGEDNKFRHPNPQVLDRLEALPASILRTDRDTAIILRTDGHQVERVRWQ